MCMGEPSWELCSEEELQAPTQFHHRFEAASWIVNPLLHEASVQIPRLT